jgi:AraC-like DNA-binding protein
MSRKVLPGRQTTPLWESYADVFPAGEIRARHRHETGQLLFAEQGVMAVVTDQGRWTIPPQRALWMPPVNDHALEILTRTQIRTIYFQTELIARNAFPRRAAIHAIAVTPLIRELIFGLFDDDRALPMRDAMAGLLLQAVGEAQDLRTYLPMPADARLREAAAALIAKGDWTSDVNAVAARAAMSERNFTRRFTAEVGLSFRSWRQRARIIASLDLLAADSPIKTVAHDVGFSGPAPYIEAFRSLFGLTPGEFRDNGG